MTSTNTVPLADILAEFSPDDQADITARSREIVRTSRSIRQLRRAMGMTQSQLAKALDVSQAYVAKVEAGRAGDMHVGTIERIVAAMGGRLNMTVSLPGREDVVLTTVAARRRSVRGARVSAPRRRDRAVV